MWMVSWWARSLSKSRIARSYRSHIVDAMPRLSPTPSGGKHVSIHPEQQLRQGVYLNHIVRHMLRCLPNCKGARQWRRYLSENAYKTVARRDVVETALGFVEA